HRFVMRLDISTTPPMRSCRLRSRTSSGIWKRASGAVCVVLPRKSWDGSTSASRAATDCDRNGGNRANGKNAGQLLKRPNEIDLPFVICHFSFAIDRADQSLN